MLPAPRMHTISGSCWQGIPEPSQMNNTWTARLLLAASGSPPVQNLDSALVRTARRNSMRIAAGSGLVLASLYSFDAIYAANFVAIQSNGPEMLSHGPRHVCARIHKSTLQHNTVYHSLASAQLIDS